jgi:CheY-like chemotaxis protein
MTIPRTQDSPLVLVIDDEQEMLDTVAAVLASANIACRCCTRPDEAFAVALESLPDLILCDLNLFGESGPEVCEQIKRQPGLEAIPVMFLSAAQMPDIIRRSHGSTSTYCIRKPFSPNVLLGLIDTAIGAQQRTASEVAQRAPWRAPLETPQLVVAEAM